MSSSRNLLKIEYRSDLPPTILALIEKRNRRKYGHAIGPTADALDRYGSGAEVIGAASTCLMAALTIHKSGANRIGCMQLIGFSCGRVSLEFAPSEGAVIVDALDRCGLVRKPGPDVDIEFWSVDGHDLTALYEWSEPCIMSGDAAGTACLRRLWRTLTAARSAQPEMAA